MRTIKTKDGKVHSGWNSDFTDKGTHIEKKSGVLFETTERIYKENIASDRESDTAGKVVTSAVLFTVSGGTLM